MDDIIKISNINDFIFCPVSIYFHNLYGNQEKLMFQSKYQLNGTKSLVCDLMEPMRPIVDYSVRKAINLEQCKKEDFEVYDNRWVLKYKMNSKYIQFLMKDILEYKDEIFVYIQKYYRFFMKMKSVEELPRFEVH